MRRVDRCRKSAAVSCGNVRSICGNVEKLARNSKGHTRELCRLRLCVTRGENRHDHCVIDTPSVLSYVQVTITGSRELQVLAAFTDLIDLNVLFPTEPAR